MLIHPCWQVAVRSHAAPRHGSPGDVQQDVAGLNCHVVQIVRSVPEIGFEMFDVGEVRHGAFSRQVISRKPERVASGPFATNLPPTNRRGNFGRFRVACLLVWCLRNNYTFAAMDFGRRLGASDEHIPKWICKERATTPPPKRHAALRVALKLAWGFVAQSVEYRWGIYSLPRASPQANLSTTNV